MNRKTSLQKVAVGALAMFLGEMCGDVEASKLHGENLTQLTAGVNHLADTFSQVDVQSEDFD